MINKHYILSVSPLSDEFINQLKIQAGQQQYHTIIAGQLRHYGGWGLLKYLRSLNAESLIIAIEDPVSLVVLPVLLLLAIFIPSQHRRLYLHNQKFVKFNYFKSLEEIAKFIIISSWAQIIRWLLLPKIKKLHARASPVSLPIKGKKILYINENLWFGVKAGGSVGHIAGVINQLQQKNYQVSYAAVSDNQQINPGVTRIHLPCFKTFVYPNELNYYKFSNLTIKYLRTWIKTHQPNIIYQRLSICNYAGAVLSKEFNIPLVLEYNGSEVWCLEKWGAGLKYKSLATLTEKLNIEQASHIVTISKNLEDELIHQGIPAQKITFYPNCIDPNIFNPQYFSLENINSLRHQYHLDHDAKLITFLGTFGKWHGTEILANSIKYLLNNKKNWLIKHKIHFLLIGDGSQMPMVKAILEECDYSDFVTFTGIIPQHLSPLYLAAADILLSPHIPNPDGSRFFGSPTKLFEYMAMGKGIIASNIEQIGEVLKNSLHADKLTICQDPGNNLAILCRPGDIDDLTQAIIFLVENPAVTKQLGINARNAALTHYTWENHVDRILKSVYPIL